MDRPEECREKRCATAEAAMTDRERTARILSEVTRKAPWLSAARDEGASPVSASSPQAEPAASAASSSP